MNKLAQQYEDLGEKWLNGHNIKEFNGIELNEPQKKFVNNKDRYCLSYGGFGSGKTTAFNIKLYLLSMMFPGNRILLGRRTRTLVEKNLLPDVFDVFPEGTYEHKVGPGKLVFPNGSEIIFYGLDSLQSGAGQDIKKAEQEIKSLNLGAVFIDQLEEVEERVVEKLSGRLRRDVGFQQMNFTCNPANFWAYDFFLVQEKDDRAAIKTSMLDNKEHLGEDFIEDQLNKPKNYVRRYVYGEWTPDVLTEGAVFYDEHIQAQRHYIKEPIREINGIKIYAEHDKTHSYRIGIDPSLGNNDPCHICVIDIDTGEEVAQFTDYVPITVQVERTLQLAKMYSHGKNKALLVPEANNMGEAFIEKIKVEWDNIYQQTRTRRHDRKKTDKLGFYTTHGSKTNLIEHFRSLLDSGFPKIRDEKTVEQMKVFIYSDEAKQKGAGAQQGFHDDRIMGKMLAFFEVESKSKEDRRKEKIKAQTANNRSYQPRDAYV